MPSMKISGDGAGLQPKWEHPLRLDERHRVAQELHDSTSHHLIALQLYLAELRCRGIAQEEALMNEMAQTLRHVEESISCIAMRRSDEDDVADEARLRVARMFYSLGSSKSSEP